MPPDPLLALVSNARLGFLFVAAYDCQAMKPDYAAWATRLLIYIAGVTTTVIGSWLSSKIRVYHDARNSHRDELKQKVLEPLRDTLRSQYVIPLFEFKWEQQKYNAQALAQETPATFGLTLVFSDPGRAAQSTLDDALFEDARVDHYKELMSGWDVFRDSWSVLLGRLEKWMHVIAQDLLDASGLPANPSLNLGSYIMPLDLAAFVCQRLVQKGLTNLDIVPEEGGKAILRLGQSQSVAVGSKEQIRKLMDLVNSLVEAHRPFALEIQQELLKLQKSRASLSRQFSLTIAAKKLSGRCSLVRFF